MKYTRKFIDARFQELLKATGNTAPAYSNNKARIGAWYLDYAACYGGYSINEIANEGGGVRQVSGWCNRMKAGELVAWMAGYMAGLERHAAAPVLLEACQSALLCIHANRGAVDPAIRNEAENKLRAAITKAKGEA